jgi:plastocyanin
MPRPVRRIAVYAGLAAFLLSGCTLFEVEEGHDAHADDAQPIDGAPEIAVTADRLSFAPASIDATVGEPLNIRLEAVDIMHDLVVDEIDFHLAADRGEVAVGGLVFDAPGTYVGYCSVPGHRGAGMELTFVVE